MALYLCGYLPNNPLCRLIMRKTKTNPHSGASYKISDQYSKLTRSSKQGKFEKLPQARGT